MSLWTAAQAVAATGGSTQGDWFADGVSIDSRSLQRGDLFVALQAARDGHDFVAQALENGAAAAVVSRRPKGVAADVAVSGGKQKHDIVKHATAMGFSVGVANTFVHVDTRMDTPVIWTY